MSFIKKQIETEEQLKSLGVAYQAMKDQRDILLNAIEKILNTKGVSAATNMRSIARKALAIHDGGPGNPEIYPVEGGFEIVLEK